MLHKISDFDPDDKTGWCSACERRVAVYVRPRAATRGRKAYTEYSCGVHRANRKREYRRNNPDVRMRERDQAGRYDQAKSHGLTERQFTELLAAQGGTCALCPETERLQIDHDHECCPKRTSCGGCVRGLLCSRHNRALGIFGDDPEALMAAVRYLMSGTDRGAALEPDPSRK